MFYCAAMQGKIKILIQLCLILHSDDNISPFDRVICRWIGGMIDGAVSLSH